MKRHGHLWEQITDFDNLMLAHKNARRGKTWYSEVRMIDKHPELYLNNIYKMLVDKTYEVSPYETFVRRESGKERLISKLPYYPDRIVQWALMQVLEPVFLKNLIYDTYSALPGRGIHFGLKRLHKAMQDKENTEYCLKFDIEKYYPSIPHSKLKEALRRKIKDPHVLWLLDKIIDSIEGDRGIPIGNYTSQYFGNFYLSKYDHWMKEQKQVKHYFRYMDDIVVLHKNKKFLHWLRYESAWFLKEQLDISIKQNWQVFPSRIRGIDFLGYRSFGDYTLLRKTIAKRFKRAMVKINNKGIDEKSVRTIASYNGWLKWCNSRGLYKKYKVRGGI